MSPKKLLLAAAKRIASGKSDRCCIAIQEVEGLWVPGYRSSPECDLALDHFEYMFSPFHCTYNYNYAGDYGMPFWSRQSAPERQRLRVMCLLFAAASYPYDHTL